MKKRQIEDSAAAVVGLVVFVTFMWVFTSFKPVSEGIFGDLLKVPRGILIPVFIAGVLTFIVGGYVVYELPKYLKNKRLFNRNKQPKT